MTDNDRIESGRQGRLGQREIDFDNDDTVRWLEQHLDAFSRYASRREIMLGILAEHLRALRDTSLRRELVQLTEVIREGTSYDALRCASDRIATLLRTVTVRDLVSSMPLKVVSAEDRSYVLARQGGTCFSCEKRLVGYWELDHHVPRSRGGGDDLDNRRALCVECNRAKRCTPPEEFYEHKEFA